MPSDFEDRFPILTEAARGCGGALGFVGLVVLVILFRAVVLSVFN